MSLSVQIGLLLSLATAFASVLGFLYKHRGAIAMPHVMNRCRQTGSISRSTVAFTTALSKDNETSRIASTATMKMVNARTGLVT